MIGARDINTWSTSYSLKKDTTAIGTIRTDYEVLPYTDVRNSTLRRGYHITCKIRMIVANPGTAANLGPRTIRSYDDYPAMLVNGITVSVRETNPHAELYLVEYSPKTLNSSITSSQDNSNSGSRTASSAFTMGSSTSETNSYDVSVNAGISVNSGHSTTVTYESSRSSGSSDTQGASIGSSDSMSIKEWASYASIDPTNVQPTWVWSQEYPWPIADLMAVSADNETMVDLPQYVVDRLYVRPSATPPASPELVLPPSKLSLFGINFLATASWIYSLGASTTPRDSLTFSPWVKYFTASHGIEDGDPPRFAASLKLAGYYGGSDGQFDVTLPLTEMALAPVGFNGANNGAVVGFGLPQFITRPSNPQGFGIKSTANNLLVTGNGFSDPSSDDAPLTAHLPPRPSTSAAAATMRIQFKIVDEDSNYTLYMKHWKRSDLGCLLRIVVNENPPIVRHVDAEAAAGGSDNITRIMLRNKDYSSPDFYDYLVMGLNTVEISLYASSDGTTPASAEYAIRALSIG